MDNTWNQIEHIAEKNGGILTTAQVETAGISRAVLKRYVEEGQLIRISKGLYVLEYEMADEYMLLQARSSKALFSHGTALFLWGLSDRTPHTIDLTVPHGTNVSKIKRDNPHVRFHYVQAPLFEIGKAETVSPQGGTVFLYDKERCICDLIRDKKEMDMQIYTQTVKDYFRTGANTRRLLKYAKAFGIEERVRTYMEVLL
ncbi:type IV toxin-antitoxin system AbiEi family antitoxin domain-containing protein [Hungatella hathewayi]|uniref:type IV toxin-antitoxin system AbiEi family antitoxin domain-containing protein n=1 Tax=Hungatella hathewayi TaxID=154046 RepID=UPI001FAA0E53|nr:type IV toxin-antitoxin system AbiEi family antitoxin domain-containing protein [Hungatella hathewayi]